MMRSFFLFAGVFAASAAAADVELLVFETGAQSQGADMIKEAAESLVGIKITVFGGKFKGFSSKYFAAEPLLRAMKPETLVILSDSRDVLVNALSGHNDADAGTQFEKTFRDVVGSAENSVAVSAEANCCVSALAYFPPGSLFLDSGARAGRSCASGMPGCYGKAGGAPIWENFMQTLAEQKTGRQQTDFALNAGLMAGKASDLLALIEALDLDETEDDQAVLTDYMFMNPESITLDYGQKLFGNNRWTHGMESGCMFEPSLALGKMVHTEKRTTPLFVHSPGKFFQCHDKLATELGQRVSTHSRRSLSNYNYATTPDPAPVPAVAAGASSLTTSTGLLIVALSALLSLRL